MESSTAAESVVNADTLQALQPASSLHYGDLIMLNAENLGAFIQSTGFSNSNLYAQKNNFGTKLFCRNQRDFVFQIQPKMNFDARKDYRQTLRFFNENFAPKENTDGEGSREPNKEPEVPMEGGPQQPPPEENKEQQQAVDPQKRLEKQAQEIQGYKKKLAGLKKKMLDEQDSNNKLVERRKGENVTYGSEIQLFHVDSASFICVKKTTADLERTCNKVELVSRPSTGIYFKILPRYKYRQEGEKIKYGDQIIFYNTKVQLYLHICDSQIPVEEPQPLPLVPGTTKNEITPVIIDRRGPPQNYVPCYEVNASTGFSRFKAIPYCLYEEDDKKFLRGGCVITLKHSELGGLLSSDDNDFTDDGLAEVFLWVFKGKEDDYENFNTQSLFEIEIALNENMGRICRTSDDDNYMHRFRLRHLNTGRLVTVQTIDFNGEKVVTLGLAEHIKLKQNPNPLKAGDNYRIADTPEFIQKLEDNTLFSFVPTNVDDDSRIKNMSCVKLQHCKSGLFVSMKANAIFEVKVPEEGHKDEDETAEISGKIYEKMADEDVNNANRHVIDMKEEAGYEDAFFLQIIDDQTLRDIMFVSTLVGALKKNIPLLCNGQQNIPKDKFLEMDLIMKMLQNFAKCEEKSPNDMGDGDNGPELDMNELEEKIIKRQKTLRELYLVEYIVQILYFPFATKTYTLAQITQDDYITLLCQDAYQLLDAAVGGYEINERYASQWINFFFSQAMRTNKQNDISAQATVEELLSDNTQLLETRITPQIIKQFIYLCKSQEKDKKLIMLLTALCTCYGKAVEHNQMFIVKFLLEDKDTNSKLMMPIRIRQGQLEVKLQGSSYITLSMLKEFSIGRDDGRIYKYFKSIVDLAANLNIGRNQYAYQQLNNLYPFDPVFSIVYDQNLPFDLRSCFLKLINSMHLDKEPLEPLEIPTTTMVMFDILPFEDFCPSENELTYNIKKSDVEIPPKLMKLKDFVLEFLLSENGVQDINNKKKNHFVQNMIGTLYFLLQHGFYQNQTEINSLALPLIMLLDGSDDVFVEEGKTVEESEMSSIRYKYTQKSEIMLVSKKIQCDCLIFMSQLELDGRAELFLSKIKRQIEMANQMEEGEDPQQEEDAKQKISLSEKIAMQVTQKTIPQLKKEQIMSLEQIKNQGPEMLQAISEGLVKKPLEKNIEVFMGMTQPEFLDLVSSMKGFEAGTGDIYVVILFDLLLYQYNELNQVAFELLVKYFNRKSTLLEALQNIQILESQKSIEILTKVKEFSSQLKDFQQEAEMFMPFNEGESKVKKASIAEIFTFLTRFLIIPAAKTPKASATPQAFKKRSSGMAAEEPEKLEDLLGKLKDDSYVKENLKPEDEISVFENEDFCMFIPQTANENKENQRLMNNFSMFEFAIYFIKYKIEEGTAQQVDHQVMVKQCYRFLIKFVKGNTQNQLKLRDYLDVFMRDIEKQSLAIQLVYEIFKDNKKFLNLNASKILKKISIASEKLPLLDSKKGLLYQLLTAFCRCKDKLVRANQQDIVTYLTSTGALSNIFYLFVGEGLKDMAKILAEQKKIQIHNEEKDLIELGISDLLKGKTKPKPQKPGEFDPTKTNPFIVVSNQIININALIELLSLCCEGKSDKAEEKCQKEILTLENSLSIVKACEYFWPLKRTIVNYVWQCFLDSNSKTIFIEPFHKNIDFIWEMAELLLADMKNILVSITQKMESEVYVKFPYKAPVSLRDESVKFLIDSILPFFKYMIKRKDVYIDEEREHIIAEFTACTVDFFYLTKDPSAKKTTYNILGYIYTRQNLSKYLDNLKHPLIGLHPGNVEQQNEEKENKQEQLETFNYDKSDSSKINKMIQSISSSEEVKEMIEKEFEELVSWFVNIEDRVKEVVQGNSNYQLESFSQLTFPNIVQALLEMLDKRELSKPLHSIGLQIVRKLIEAENKNCLTPAADWDTEDYIEFKGQIVSKQDALVEIGVVQFLCKHIADLEDDQLLEQCVLLGITLLLGGNNNSQQAFLAYFQENDTYNRTLSRLKQTMIKEFERAKVYLAEKNAKLSMIAKTQEKMALYLMKKIMKMAKNEDKNEEKSSKAKKGIIEAAPEEIPFAPEADEEEEQVPQAFDNTLENLMTIQQTQAGDLSLMTGQEGAGEEGKKESEPKDANQNQNSLKRVIRILRMLQLMAEGHYRPLQDHLREQKMSDGQPNPRTFDFVAFISGMLGVFQKQFLNCYSHELGSQMLDTLVEVIQGPCKDNQRSLVSSKAIDNCRDILNHGNSERELKLKGFTDDKVSMVDELKQKAVKLLLSITEGPIDANIMKGIKKTLDDFEVIFQRMKQVYETFLTEVLNLDPEQATLSQIQSSLSIDSFDDDAIAEGFDLYSLVRSMADSVGSVDAILQNYVEEPYIQFFMENTGVIEIFHDESQQILKVYFPIKPVCLYLSKQTRSILMREVDRSSPQQKIMDLLKAVPDIVDEMDHIEVLSRATIKVTPALTDRIRLIGLINALAICILITAFYGYGIGTDSDGNNFIEPTAGPEIKLAIGILGGIQIFIQVLLIIGEIITRGTLIIKSKWREYIDEKKAQLINLVNAKKEAPGYSEFNIIKAPELSLLDARLVLLTSGPDAEEFIEDAETGKKNFGHLILKIEYMWTSLSFILSDGRFFFLLTLLGFALLGQFNSPAFFSCILLDIVNRFPSLQNVIKAVTTNSDQLIMSAMLELILVWMYTVFYFQFFPDSYYNDDITLPEGNEGDTAGDNICRSLFHCYMSTLNFGLRNGGGIADSLNTNSWFNDSKEVYLIRSTVDLSYMLIIILLFFNIIFGIIIDTFAGLRDEAAVMEDDMKNVCFICGTDRQTFDKDSANGYMYHIKKEHNLWKYVFFMIYMNAKDTTEYTGIETYVSNKVTDDDIAWFPFNKAICLEASAYQIDETTGPAEDA